jgi:hypothetical protein
MRIGAYRFGGTYTICDGVKNPTYTKRLSSHPRLNAIVEKKRRRTS